MGLMQFQIAAKDQTAVAFSAVTARIKELRDQVAAMGKTNVPLSTGDIRTMNALTREADGLEKSLVRITGQGTQASRSLSSLGAIGYAGIAAAAVGVAKLGAELGQLGESAQRTEQYFTAFSGSADIAAQNLKAMQNAAGGALTSQQAMQSATKLLSMGLATNATELERIAHMAVMLGGSTRTASEAIEEFSLLLANQSILRLDTFGISGARVRARIEELQAATAGMSREAAFMAAVMEEGSAKVQQLETSGVKAATSTDVFKASVAELKTELGKLVAQPYEVVVNFITNPVQKLTKAITEEGHAAREYEDALRRVADAEANLAGLREAGYTWMIKGAEAELEAARAALTAAEAQRELASSTSDARIAFAGSLAAIGATIAQYHELANVTSRVNEVVDRAAVEAARWSRGTSPLAGEQTRVTMDELKAKQKANEQAAQSAANAYEREMRAAIDKISGYAQSKLSQGVSASIGLSDLRTGVSNEPGKGGAFENIYRLQAWLKDNSWAETAAQLGITSKEQAAKIVQDFQNQIFSPEVISAIDTDMLISQIKLEQASEASRTAFAQQLANAAGVSVGGGAANSKVSEAFAQGAEAAVNADNFKARMAEVGVSAWGWTEAGFVKAARNSTALRQAFEALAASAIASQQGALSASNAAGNP